MPPSIMTDYFTERFIAEPKAFAALHERLEKYGYVTEDDDPQLNRPCHNTLTNESYQLIFGTHYPSQFTFVHAATTAFDVGFGFRSFYVAYDREQFADRDELEHELKRAGVLK